MSDKVSVNEDVLGAWLCLCQKKCSEREINSVFDPEQIGDLVSELKTVMCANERDLPKKLTQVLAEYGICFNLVHNFRGAPVHGYIERKEDQTYQMVLTLRGAYADIFWFSLFHELGHIVNGDLGRSGSLIDVQDSKDQRREEQADLFAGNALLEPESYQQFVRMQSYTYAMIREYAKSQQVPPYIVIGRLQKEERIPWNRFQNYKLRYKWADQA